jgi:hypothetical protein
MTEASSADGLERALALCALAFSNAGREGLLDLLPDDLAAQVGDWLRRPEALTARASSGLEVALLARSTAPPTTKNSRMRLGRRRMSKGRGVGT